MYVASIVLPRPTSSAMSIRPTGDSMKRITGLNWWA
jgi:hypothetical protein